MTTYIDTSAFIALMDQDATEHQSAGKTWTKLMTSDEQLVTSNYVVVETCALLQRRFGMQALRTFLEDILPAVLIEWVDVPLHSAGLAALLASGRHGPNIVDCISFATMHKLAIKSAFSYDAHFSEQGFDLESEM